jgi:hypothetical protein
VLGSLAPAEQRLVGPCPYRLLPAAAEVRNPLFPRSPSILSCGRVLDAGYRLIRPGGLVWVLGGRSIGKI